MDDDFSVLVVQTGGTIDKDYPRSSGQYAFEIGDSAALRILQESFAPVTFAVHALTVCKKDSQVRSFAGQKYACCRRSRVTNISSVAYSTCEREPEGNERTNRLSPPGQTCPWRCPHPCIAFMYR